MKTDETYMKHALALGRRGLGMTAPNPSVGCIIVRDDVIIGRGITQKGGRPHAEVVALQEAGNAKGATAYVTLEPCAHEGHTPPCSKTLIKAGVSRVVIAMQDPDLRVAGQGIKHLKDAGIEVVLGVCENEAKLDHRGHLTRLLKNRPFVQLKMALSMDGFVAGENNARVQISGEEAWTYTHLMRAMSDAIMVGHGTYLSDKPLLNVRLPGLEDRSPRVIIQRSSEPLGQTLSNLANEGITRLMVEGGVILATSFLDQDLIDEIHLIKSKNFMIERGLKGFSQSFLTKFTLAETLDLRDDTIEIWRR